MMVQKIIRGKQAREENKKLHASAIMLQKTFRRQMAKLKYFELKLAGISLEEQQVGGPLCVIARARGAVAPVVRKIRPFSPPLLDIVV